MALYRYTVNLSNRYTLCNAMHTEKRDMRIKYRIQAFSTLHIQRKGAFCSTDKGFVKLLAENKT
jgi:hypothetical protein